MKMNKVMLGQKGYSDNDLEAIMAKNLSKTFVSNFNQEKFQEFLLNFQKSLKESNIVLYTSSINYEKEVDKILEQIENHETPDIKNLLDKLNYVGEEGESIVSFILKNSDFYLKNEICSQELQKQKVSDDVKMTINSAMSYTEMPIEDVQELVGHVFDNNINDFGVC